MKYIVPLLIFMFISSGSAYSQGTFTCPPGSTPQVVGTGIICVSSGATSGSTGVVQTALGPINTEPAELVKWVLGWSIVIGGGIAVLLSLWGGVTIILAGGNPEKINEGKEVITSAVSGLLFIMFSIFLLRLIGVNILGIFDL